MLMFNIKMLIFTSSPVTGSMSVLVLYWSWTGYNKYVSKENPEYNEEVSDVLKKNLIKL